MKITTKLLRELIEQLGGEVELTVSREMKLKDGAWSCAEKSLLWTIRDVSSDRPLWHKYNAISLSLLHGPYVGREEKLEEALRSRGHKSMHWNPPTGLRVWNDPV